MGVDDLVQDGNIAYTIVTAPAMSTDGNYNNLNAADVAVTNTDNEVAGVSMNPNLRLVIAVAGVRPPFSTGFCSQPAGNVANVVVSLCPQPGGVRPGPEDVD